MKNLSNPKIIRAADVAKMAAYRPQEMEAPGKTAPGATPKKARMTAAELEALQKQAYDEAFEQGKKEVSQNCF